jgi:hypothetical protein
MKLDLSKAKALAAGESLGTPTGLSDRKGRSIKVGESVKVKPTKSKPCFIYKGVLKSHPDIMLTQIRISAFKSVEECVAVCEALFESYQIKDDKTAELLVNSQKY